MTTPTAATPSPSHSAAADVTPSGVGSNFIRSFWRANAHRWNNRLVVRFPPEPNGHLHIGHVRALLTNSDLATEFGGTLLIRMDDTNPEAERPEFEAAILSDIAWLGVKHDPIVRYASDHFVDLHALACALIDSGEAYMDMSSKEVFASRRGSFTVSDTESPGRSNPPSLNRALFDDLCAGRLGVGEGVLRLKMDLGSSNMLLRDPVLWRSLDAIHPRLPNWVAFPSYDFAHPFCDLRDGVTLSLCSLEFEEHKPIYNAIISRALHHGFTTPSPAPPEELEFARLTPDVGVTSKRLINAVITEGHARGWDDPRLLTLAGLRAKGMPPEALCAFVRELGVSRANSVAPMTRLEMAVRNHWSSVSKAVVVSDPVRMFVHEPDTTETHMLWAERDDVNVHLIPGFLRLAPGNIVRLMNTGWVVKVMAVHVDEAGAVAHVDTIIVPVKSGTDPNPPPDAVAKKKIGATVHVLGASARPLTMVRHAWWDGATDHALCETHYPRALADPLLWELAGPVHMPRLGWGSWSADKLVWLFTVGMPAMKG